MCIRIKKEKAKSTKSKVKQVPYDIPQELIDKVCGRRRK